MGRNAFPQGGRWAWPRPRSDEGELTEVSYKRAALADLPLISRLRAAASPKGEAGDFYFDSFFSSALRVSHSFWLKST